MAAAELWPLPMRVSILQGWIVGAKRWQVKTKETLTGFMCTAEIIQARIRTWASLSVFVP